MLTREKVVRLRRLVQEGLPVAHIAKEIGCGRTRVYTEKRRLEKARGKNRKPTSVRKSRLADPLGAFRERARKIELVERIRGIKNRAEEMANGVELAGAEKEGLIALAKQCDEAIDAMPSFSASDAALISKELEARSGETSRKVSTRIDVDHRLAVSRGRVGQLNRQLNALERNRQNLQEELRNLEEQIAARRQELALVGDLAEAKRTFAEVQAQIRASQMTLRDQESLIDLVRERAFTEWLSEVTSSVPMTEVKRNGLDVMVLRRHGLFEPNRG